MGFFSFGRIIGAFFNQLFRWLFWNKTGQKILFVLVIAVILVAFVKLGEVAAVEPDNFGTYEEIDFDGTIDNRALGGIRQITDNQSYFIKYIELNPYNYYLLYNSGPDVRCGLTNSLEVGSSVADWKIFSSSDDDFFVEPSSYKYLVVSFLKTNPGSVSLYYNAYPYEVSPFVYYNYSFYNSLHYIEAFNGGKFIAYPVQRGFAYRWTLSASSSGTYSFGFVNSLDFINTNFSKYQVADFTFNYDAGNGVDFVAPDSGYLIIPGNYINFKLFSSDINTSVVNSSSSVNQNINQSTSAINEVNSSLTDSSISEDDSDYTLPDSGVTDIAESGFANIFDKLRTAFTSESSGQGLVVQVPFTNKSFTISKNTVFGNAQLGIVGTLINSFWYFLVSLWIVKDIAHKMNMIKSGNIELAQTSNIKEDLL